MAYEAPSGKAAGLGFAEAGYAPPAGHQVGLAFGEAARPETPVYAGGIEPPEVPAPGVSLWVRHLAPPGAEFAEIGVPTLWNSDQYVRVPGADHSLTGTAQVWNFAQDLIPRGFDLLGSGAPELRNRNRFVSPSGVRPPEPQFGEALDLTLRTRFLTVSDLDAAEFGAAFLSHFVRTLGARGAGFDAWGALRVSHKEQVLSPPGIGEEFPSNHTVATSRELQPWGWLSEGFGERVLPEIARVYPQGFQEEFGESRFWNRRQTLHPPGFLTCGLQPEDGQGTPQVWNLRQYLAVATPSDSDLAPPGWSIWTRVANRNRVVAPQGFPFDKFGYTQIDNAARPLLPGGPDASGPSKPMVAYRVREISLEGIESPYMGIWHRVYNDARLVAPSGQRMEALGAPALVNTRRFFKFQGFDAQAFGDAMIADRIRGIVVERRHGIDPPIVPLPEAKLHTRYALPPGEDASRVGWASFEVHFTKILPRWSARETWGAPELRNLTPELYQRGRDGSEFGDAQARLEWRPVIPHETHAMVFGRPEIADRTKRLSIPGTHSLAFGDKLTVKTAGTPPYVPQTILLDALVEDEAAPGHGIAPPEVGEPTFLGKSAFPEGFYSFISGELRITANTIRVEPGYYDFFVGEPSVSHWLRILDAPSLQEISEVAPCRVSPHTIWATLDTPAQAKTNHPGDSWEPIDSWARFGAGESGYLSTMRVTLRHRVIGPVGFSTMGAGIPELGMMRRHLLPVGIRSFRAGWPEIPGDREIRHFDAPDAMEFGGEAQVAFAPYLGTQQAEPREWDSAGFGGAELQHFHRELRPSGLYATQMGESRGGNPYQWQSLHVGPPMPTIPQGNDLSCFGTSWVSFYVRELYPEGSDFYLCDYDFDAFDRRMRVWRASEANAGGNRPASRPDARSLIPPGLDEACFGVADASHHTRYVIPDGNADQYRKGAPQWQIQ